MELFFKHIQVAYHVWKLRRALKRFNRNFNKSGLNSLLDAIQKGDYTNKQ